MTQSTRMLKLFITLFLFLFFSPVYATDLSEKKSVQDAYYAWCKAIGAAKGNPQIVVKFYAPNAILLPTLSSEILHNTDGGLNNYFTRLTSYPDIHCTPKKLLTRMHDKTAINSGTYDFIYADDHGKQKIIPARFTFVYEKINGEWLIVKHHSSKLP